MAFQSLEDLLIQQTQKLQDLENATMLVQSEFNIFFNMNFPEIFSILYNETIS